MTSDTIADRFDNVRQRFEARLDALSADIRLFEARLDSFAQDNRRRAEEELETLRARRDDLRRRLGEAQDSASDAAADLEEGLEKAWSDIAQALDKARDRFKS